MLSIFTMQMNEGILSLKVHHAFSLIKTSKNTINFSATNIFHFQSLPSTIKQIRLALPKSWLRVKPECSCLWPQEDHCDQNPRIGSRLESANTAFLSRILCFLVLHIFTAVAPLSCELSWRQSLFSRELNCAPVKLVEQCKRASISPQ